MRGYTDIQIEFVPFGTSTEAKGVNLHLLPCEEASFDALCARLQEILEGAVDPQRVLPARIASSMEKPA